MCRRVRGPGIFLTGDRHVKTTATTQPAEHLLFEPRHEQFRQTVRAFVEREVNPHAELWEQEEKFPKSLFLRGGELGFFAQGVPEEFGGSGIDCRMAMVMGEELSKGHTRGVGMGFGAHNEIAKPHLVRFGTDSQKRQLPGRDGCRAHGRRPVRHRTVRRQQRRRHPDGRHPRRATAGRWWAKRCSSPTHSTPTYCSSPPKPTPDVGHRGISMFLVDRQTPGISVENDARQARPPFERYGALPLRQLPAAGRRAVGPRESGLLPDHAVLRARAAGDRGRLPRRSRWPAWKTRAATCKSGRWATARWPKCR